MLIENLSLRRFYRWGPTIGAYITILILGLIISCLLSGKFADFAAQKGYERSHYFWICFFFGMLGYVWVAALPDAALYNELAVLRKENYALTGQLSAAAAPAEKLCFLSVQARC